MMIVDLFRRHPIAFSLVTINAAVIIILLAIFIINARKTAGIDILVTPSTATIKVGNAEYTNGNYNIAPGEYNVMISADGFETQTFSIVANPGESVRISTVLDSVDGSFNYYLENPDEIETLKSVSDPSTAEFIARYNRAVAIRSVLPLRHVEYDGNEIISDIIISESDVSRCSSFICLHVSSLEPVSQEFVDSMVQDAGFDPADYAFDFKIYMEE